MTQAIACADRSAREELIGKLMKDVAHREMAARATLDRELHLLTRFKDQSGRWR